MNETRTAAGGTESEIREKDPPLCPAAEEESDETLVARFLAGGRRDDPTFAEIFRRRRLDVWRVCWGFFGNRQDAEDVTQEVFFTVYRKLPQFKGQSSFRTWLHRIAANTCKNELRHRLRRPQGRSTDLEDAAPIAARTESAEERVIREREQDRLARALTELSSEERDLLRLVEFEGRPYADIAAGAGISVSGVKMRVLRARLSLADAYRRLEGKGVPT